MTVADIPVSQALLVQLGYHLDLPEVRRRYDAVAASADHVLMIADQGGHVIALCHAYLRPALDKPPEAVVQALVVDQASRGSGVGKIMMAAAEAWATERGFTSIALASDVSRAGAHAFYEALGYRRAATSHQFRKTFGPWPRHGGRHRDDVPPADGHHAEPVFRHHSHEGDTC